VRRVPERGRKKNEGAENPIVLRYTRRSFGKTNFFSGINTQEEKKYSRGGGDRRGD